MQNYKKIAIKFLKKEDFKNALVYFSLAYQRAKNKRLLIFIDLCHLGIAKPVEGILLTCFYLDNYTHKGVDKDMSILILKAQANAFKESFDYKDFCYFEEKLGFNTMLDSISLYTKMVIDNKDEFLSFLNKLLENDRLDMVLGYLEHLYPHFIYNKKFFDFCSKLRLYNENKARK